MCLFSRRLAVSAALLVLSAGAIAQEEGDSAEGAPIVPVELYACKFHDGKGNADLDQWVAKWNTWVDGQDVPYSAWTLTPFYYGSDQDFDFAWLGVSPDAATLGRAYDKYLAEGSLEAAFAEFANCGAHGNFATMNFKEPPDDDSPNFVLNFSDCKRKEGKSFDDIYPALKAWSAYRTEHGSKAGMWVMWPAFGGGNADFDFKIATSYPNYEALGEDYDQYGREGYKKADELFSGLVDCDEARSYVATQRRDGIPDED
jgi:hypothetical protein